jgi:hypothetical protein
MDDLCIEGISINKQIQYIESLLNVKFTGIQKIECMKHKYNYVKINRNNEKVVIHYKNKHEVFVALKEILLHIDQLTYSQTLTPKIETLGYMVDCARNAVPKIHTLKQLLVNLALLGYRYLGLYLEDLIPLEDEPFFGYMRGQYTKEELTDLVDFGIDYGIEIRPYIQTLAHLPNIFKHQQYQSILDQQDILLVGEPKTYELIEKMIISAKTIFKTNHINIGMDEAWQLGLGKYLSKNGYQNRLDIMLKHLDRVNQICIKHQINASMWADMFFHLKDGQYLSDKVTNFSDISHLVPQNIELIYWDYYQVDKQKYMNKIKALKSLSQHMGYAGGAWKWIGLTPLNEFSMYTMNLAMDACVETNINHMTLTAWGDNGAEASIFSVLPTIIDVANNHYKEDLNTSDTLKLLTNYDLSKWLLLDKLNQLYQTNKHRPVNPSKYLLYEDILMGHPKIYVDLSYKDIYEKLTKAIKPLLKTDSTYTYIFDTISQLSRVLEIKSTLSLQIYDAYMNKNKRELKVLILKISSLIKEIEQLNDKFRTQWFKENKMFGFEVQTYRLGGFIGRLKEVIIILNNYINGLINNIEILDVRRLTTRKDDDLYEGCIYFNQFANHISLNNTP